MSSISSRKDCSLIHGLNFERIRIDHGSADVAQRIVHGVRQRVNGRTLVIAGYDYTRAAVCQQIHRNPADEGFVIYSGSRSPPALQGARQVTAEQLHVLVTQRQTMIGFAAGAGHAALDSVEPVHVQTIASAAANGEVARISEPAGPHARKSESRETTRSARSSW